MRQLTPIPERRARVAPQARWHLAEHLWLLGLFGFLTEQALFARAASIDEHRVFLAALGGVLFVAGVCVVVFEYRIVTGAITIAYAAALLAWVGVPLGFDPMWLVFPFGLVLLGVNLVDRGQRRGIL